ncbi:hypothetical protein FYJ75_09065 [Roseburia sp. MUC/MUC-530-WT-4D]|uniref:Uncharacterized protein n=1 Tax=Roseburia porci TaxID=2605790 RepID=A0A6L5YT78_9FIRM|nr:hypothetical protein [Roseburia porci]MCI5518162.1 hypothetical protein [Roseburia sp.]MDD6741930.1 hypothetical protein [Roseburia porci]MST75176.1 hypothetical protein [Roseburia porci]
MELNASDQILGLTSGKTSGIFTYMGIDFFPNATLRDLDQIRLLHYDYLISDFGVFTPDVLSGSVHSSACMIVGSVSQWNTRRYGSFIMSLEKQRIYQEPIIFLDNLGSKKESKTMKRLYHTDVIPFPYLTNPFQLTFDDLEIFKRLLGKI